MDNSSLNVVVASLLQKMEPPNLPNYEIPTDLKDDITIVKDALPLLLDPNHIEILSPNDRIDVEKCVCKANNLLDAQVGSSSKVVEDESLKSVISRLALLLKDVMPSEITEFVLSKKVEELPPYLLDLFVYCSSFPKGHRFVRETLVNQWMAQGLLSSRGSFDKDEDVGNRYFAELLSRGSFDKDKDKDEDEDVGNRYFAELLSRGSFDKDKDKDKDEDVGNRYFAELLSRGLFQEPVFAFGHSDSSVYCCKMHPLAHDAALRLAGKELFLFNRGVLDDYSSAVGQQTKHIAFHREGFSRINLEMVTRNCLSARTIVSFSSTWNPFFETARWHNLLRLRVLDLTGCQFREFPPLPLSSLKYLGLSRNVILESISRFPCLETLAVDGCDQLKEVSKYDFRNLRHLYFTSRHRLLNFYNLFTLRTLEISHCMHLTHSKPFFLLNLKTLRIYRCPKFRMEVPYLPRLEELVLHSCKGLIVPRLTKLGFVTPFRRLTKLEIVSLPIVELPNCFQSAKALQYFMIADCAEIEQLNVLRHLQSLQELFIYNCPKLCLLLPEEIYSLTNLRLLDVRNCPNFIWRNESITPEPPFIKFKQEMFDAPQFSEAGKASHSKPNILEVYLDGHIQDLKFSAKREPKDQRAPHLPQRVPYFNLKSQLIETGMPIKHRWRPLALVFRAVMRMKTLSATSEELLKLHCCLFPDDYEFEREKLIQLWMAVEMLGHKCMENAGKERFDILLEEQYILHARDDILTGRSKYKVNYDKVKSLINGMQTIKNKDLYVKIEDENASVVGRKIWHVSLVSHRIDQATFETLKTFKELRTLLLVRNYGSSLEQIPSDMFLALKSIQALDLSGSHITELPSSIGNVIQLRYLDLSFTLIESLPESIDRLHQLQTLKLEGCKHIHILPTGLKKLIGLRYLEFDVLGQLTFMPKGIGALTELRTLSAFIVDSGESCSIGELKNMNNLRGSFCISGLENASQHEVQEATLSAKMHLTRLQLRWNDFKSYSADDKGAVLLSFLHLEPHSCLEELEILYYPGLRLPPWIGSEVFENLATITLIRCAIVDLQISLGKLPSLKNLNIIHMHRLPVISDLVHTAGSFGARGTFPKLKTLQMDGMPNFKAWRDVRNGDFPLLSKLIIKQCPKLIELPFLPCLHSLNHLEISHCKLLRSLSDGGALSTSLQTFVIDNCPLLKERYKREGEDWCKIEHVPDISIDLKDIRSTLDDDDDDDDDSSAGSLSY